AGANRPGDADQQPGNGRLSRRRRRCRAGGCGQGRRRGQGSLSGLARPAGAGEVGAPASGRRHSARTCRGTGAHRRVFVHEDILDDVLSVLPQSLSAIRVGLPTDPDATMGSLSSEMQYRKTLEYIEIAKSEGARLVFGGRALTDGPLAGGFYIEPTVF